MYFSAGIRQAPTFAIVVMVLKIIHFVMILTSALSGRTIVILRPCAKTCAMEESSPVAVDLASRLDFSVFSSKIGSLRAME